jgi:PAS domain S-box-containing protein
LTGSTRSSDPALRTPPADASESGDGRRAPDATEASLLGSLADAVPHLVWVAGVDGRVREYSRLIETYGGRPSPAGAGWAWEPMVHPDDLGDTALAWHRAIETGTPYEHEHRLRMADGSYRWHLSRGIPMTAASGHETLWYGTATDIHDVRRAEEELRGTQSALALAMRGGRLGWWQRDLTTSEVTWSPELEELFGLPPGGFRGDQDAFLRFVHPDDRAGVESAVEGAVQTGEDYVIEFRFQHADGSWRWMEGRGRATYVDGRPTFLHGIGMDITSRMEHDASIRAREERLRLAAEAGDFGLYDYDLESGASYWSPELHRILGWDGDATSPRTAPIHPDDQAEVIARFEAAQGPQSDGDFDFEYRIVRGDGTIRWVSTHGRTFFSAPDPSPDRRALRSIGVVLDVTDRKQADELRDVFVGMLSHELRTPVTSIYGGSQVLRRENVDEATRREIVADIVTESERLERLVENLLVLARAERHVKLSGRDPVSLRPLLTRIVTDKRRRWPDRTIEVDLEPALPPVASDDGSVELVLRNLLSNALKYGLDRGIVRATARRAGDFVQVCVEDDGPGIVEADAGRLFELFYRAEDARRRAPGAGIGLFVVRVLLEAAGGRVSAANRPEGGARFCFSLPVFVESDDDAALG